MAGRSVTDSGDGCPRAWPRVIGSVSHRFSAAAGRDAPPRPTVRQAFLPVVSTGAVSPVLRSFSEGGCACTMPLLNCLLSLPIRSSAFSAPRHPYAPSVLRLSEVDSCLSPYGAAFCAAIRPLLTPNFSIPRLCPAACCPPSGHRLCHSKPWCKHLRTSAPLTRKCFVFQQAFSSGAILTSHTDLCYIT
jgi:hypothetical protein